MSRPDFLAAVVVLIAGGALLGWWRTRDAVHAERIRRGYVDDRLPLFVRTSLATAPLAAVGMVLLVSLLFLPRLIAAWLSIPVLGLIAVAFALPYVRPMALLPPWLRDEIEAGVTPVARPDWGDWLLFAIVVPVMTLGLIAGPILIIVYGAAGP